MIPDLDLWVGSVLLAVSSVGTAGWIVWAWLTDRLED